MGTLDASYFRIAGEKVPGWKDAKDGLHDRCDLRHSELDLDRWLEVDADDGDALIGLGLTVLDVVDGSG